MPQLSDLSRSLVTLEQSATLIAVIEMSQSSWLVAGIVPGIERQPLKKLAVDENALLKLLHRWRQSILITRSISWGIITLSSRGGGVAIFRADDARSRRAPLKI